MDAGRSWLVPSVVGLVVGIAVAGGPLGYMVSQLQGQVAQLKTQAAADAATASATVAQLRTSLASDADKITQLQATTATQSAQEQQLAKPDLPVEVSFRRPLLAKSGPAEMYVLNASPGMLTVTLEVRSEGVQSAPAVYQLAPNRAQRIEQWKFNPGDKVRLSNPGFRSIVREMVAAR
jgi:hypothetical protein